MGLAPADRDPLAVVVPVRVPVAVEAGVLEPLGPEVADALASAGR